MRNIKKIFTKRNVDQFVVVDWKIATTNCQMLLSITTQQHKLCVPWFSVQRKQDFFRIDFGIAIIASPLQVLKSLLTYVCKFGFFFLLLHFVLSQKTVCHFLLKKYFRLLCCGSNDAFFFKDFFLHFPCHAFSLIVFGKGNATLLYMLLENLTRFSKLSKKQKWQWY